ncbi:MAG: SAM-dependent methyltransferase [Zunongwangia sp.]|uniref:tRNA (5-methylaminomethyl-2-thiouridine)(34)-methyltransferase MnmD n=1 Tax=Zunongwangia profunda TaxID=398743 RepID=UPI000C51662D|nr:tRNA (5-methylaminomethyl-2-thiouridine)(34)-methyltransferase MnmD [Zunongwangia profunda]MAO38492.1 SAM-dependent methyltransferase [Zunongwangia sp.]MAS71812.1 SAM-dependent methyltransferase [Zunongwangia sp.]HAJ80874.1 SAM-dependent methyltransferase [Zunongwangia profunda]
MERKIIKTGDGSSTIHIPEWNEQYHSKHGALQEAMHVFIRTGLDFTVAEFNKNELSILEIGFGTGLNALLTAFYGDAITINYTGVEAYPVKPEELAILNYASVLPDFKTAAEVFNKMHHTEWEKMLPITAHFNLKKQEKTFQEIDERAIFDLIYFDAFGARVQPELWTEPIFLKMYNSLKLNGVLVTYAAKGSVRRAMQAVGFTVERLPGPPGKREMLRAVKK